MAVGTLPSPCGRVHTISFSAHTGRTQWTFSACSTCFESGASSAVDAVSSRLQGPHTRSALDSALASALDEHPFNRLSALPSPRPLPPSACATGFYHAHRSPASLYLGSAHI
ncbi:hypothetical protein L1887_48302 [Cichorium endivia]|nr:hypothetical protein L1887_48302 [Cichorium endivia]